MALNASWHRRHPMPANATLEQRRAWHLAHHKHCACRPIPPGLLGQAAPARRARRGGGTSAARRRRGARRSVAAAVLGKLDGGDRRSIGRSSEVVEDILRRPELLAALFDGMVHQDPIVRMRSADAAEKATRDRPEWLTPHKHRLLGDVAAVGQAEVRWHVAQMLPRLELGSRDEARALRTLRRYLDDDSRIVKTLCMQALADFAWKNPRIKPRIVPVLERLTRTGSPAMRSRGRRLLARLRG